MQTLSGVVAVFIGIWLALIVERRRRDEDPILRDQQQSCEFDRATDTLLGSVVKNTAEAKRILRLPGNPNSPRPIHSGLESSVWYATQDRFIALSRNVDERIIFAQFFDDVRRLQAFVDFHCNLHVSATTARLDRDDPGLRVLMADTDQRLAELAEDLRFYGMLLITDHGKPVHKRLMGIRAELDPATVGSG